MPEPPDSAGAGTGGLLARLLPAGVTCAEAGSGELGGPAPALYPGEEAGLGEGAVPGRRAAYQWGRALARRAMADLGAPPAAIGRGSRRQPLWPDGLVGSITHCAGYCAAAVARASGFASVGVDAEVVQPLRDGLLERIASQDELAPYAGHDGSERLGMAIFSAKEAVYKAWFPLAERWLGFEDAAVDLGEPPAGDGQPAPFRAKLLVPGPVSAFDGWYGFAGGLVLAAVAVPR